MVKKAEVQFVKQLYRETTSVPDFLLHHYEEVGLTAAEVLQMMVMHASMDKGENSFGYEDLRPLWNGDEKDLQATLASFVKRGYLRPDGDVDFNESYNFDGLTEQLFEVWMFRKTVPKKTCKTEIPRKNNLNENLKADIKALYQLFEGELARPLSPTEMEKITCWLGADAWSVAMIKEATKRAVMHGTRNFAYIDKILLRWKSEKISTLEQLAEAETAKENSKVQKPAAKTAKKPANDKGKQIISNKIDYNQFME